MGVRFDAVTNATVKNNFVGGIKGFNLDEAAGFGLCSIDQSACRDVFVTGNIVAGAGYAGIIFKAHECGDSAT